ncbi:MAG: hypothetical protein J5863_03960, partial [Desulfovibrio sp.]|nr:hypothetical protein [Desulfovibrio sp.]
DFIKALEEWKDLQKNTTIPEYLFGVAAAEQLLAAARANANAALANRVSQNNTGPDYQAVEKAVFAQVRAEFGSGPDSVRGLDKKTREEVLYPKIRQHDGPVTPQVYGAILREAILSGQRLSILAESLKSQWQTQGHNPALHPNDSYWTSMAAGVMERLARGDSTARARLAGLETAGTARAANDAIASMQAALDHAIALAARADAAAVAAQAHVYDSMARATGQKAEQIKGYRPLRLSNEFALIATEILLGNTSEDQVDKAFMDKAKELVDRRLSFISSVDGLGLSPAVARRWKNSLLTEETPPPVPFAAIRELGDTIDLGPLREALASYRRMKDDGLSREDMRAGIQTLYDILQGLGVTAQKTLFDSNLWPKNCGADAFTQLGVYLCDYLMDRNPDLRFALLHPDLRADLESENASRSGQTDAQGFIRVGFYSGFVGVSTTRQAENEKELENLVKNANGQFRKVLGERLHIPQIYLSKAKPVGLEARAKQLADDIRMGRLPLPGEEAVFSNEAAFMTLMEQAVQVYAEAYLRVDEQGGLSEQAAAQMKDFLLTLSLPLPGGLSVADIFTVAGQTDARTFLSMLTVDNPVGAVASSWAGLVDGISRACANRIGAQQWAALSQEEKANVLSLAWMAVQAAGPGLREALADKGPGLLAGVEGSLGASNANPLIKEHFPMMRAIVNNAAGNAKSDNDSLANSIGAKANLGDMSPMNAQMLEQSILHLREHYGPQCLPDETLIVLDLRLPENGGKTLRNVLQERIREADHSVTPRELANMTAELLLPVAQAQAAANRLRELARAGGIGTLHPETLAFALNTLRAVYPQMETFAMQENAEGILTLLAAIPQEEVLAILRDAHVIQGYADPAMAQALSEATGLIPGYALKLLDKNGRNMESAFGEGYRAMLIEARANPNSRLTGEALANWCKDQAGKAIAPWADAIAAIKASPLPEATRKVLLQRALLEADPSVLTKALA